VLDGVTLDSFQGRRLALLTEIALARLLEQHGTVTRISSGPDEQQKDNNGREIQNPRPATMRVPPNANDARWAEELAQTLYRAIDRTF
jgi:hypothetical protein